jgi:hypothetical protein
MLFVSWGAFVFYLLLAPLKKRWDAEIRDPKEEEGLFFD